MVLPCINSFMIPCNLLRLFNNPRFYAIADDDDVVRVTLINMLEHGFKGYQSNFFCCIWFRCMEHVLFL